MDRLRERSRLTNAVFDSANDPATPGAEEVGAHLAGHVEGEEDGQKQRDGGNDHLREGPSEKCE
eukprot:4155335-Pyramimonas_sp.AAC.1